MTRAEAEAFLKTLGISEPTKEQIDAHLDALNKAIKKEKDRADRLEEVASKSSELAAELEKIKNRDLSAEEKAKKQQEAYEKRIAELEANQKKSEQREKLREAGLNNDVIDKFFTESGDVDYATLGQILSEAKANGASEKEKELAGKASNPGGGKAGSESNEKSLAEKTAEAIGKSLGAQSKASADILSKYIS